MIKNINKNRFWLWQAVTTYGLGIIFIINNNVFGAAPPRHTPIEQFDDPAFVFVIGIVGTLALVYTLWDIKHLYYKAIMAGLLTAVWLLFFIVLTLYDIERGRVLGFENFFALVVLGSLLHEIITGS
jgi:uncharacterized membrane protein YhaH (DUF805 family)